MIWYGIEWHTADIILYRNKDTQKLEAVAEEDKVKLYYSYDA